MWLVIPGLKVAHWFSRAKSPTEADGNSSCGMICQVLNRYKLGPMKETDRKCKMCQLKRGEINMRDLRSKANHTIPQPTFTYEIVIQVRDASTNAEVKWLLKDYEDMLRGSGIRIGSGVISIKKLKRVA